MKLNDLTSLIGDFQNNRAAKRVGVNSVEDVSVTIYCNEQAEVRIEWHTTTGSPEQKLLQHIFGEPQKKDFFFDDLESMIAFLKQEPPNVSSNGNGKAH